MMAIGDSNRQRVVFDLDGTLIESEQIWEDVRHDFVVSNGGRWRDDAQVTMIGMRTEEWARYMHEDLAVPLPEGAIATRVVEMMSARLSEHVPVLPGAQEALQRLAPVFPLGLATSAARPVAQTVLAKTGWERFFEVVVSADEVARGKPAPDVYLRAIELIGGNDLSAAAIEDSANGIRSAHGAGLTVIAIPNAAFPPDAKALALAARVLNNLTELDVTCIREVLRHG